MKKNYRKHGKIDPTYSKIRTESFYVGKWMWSYLSLVPDWITKELFLEFIFYYIQGLILDEDNIEIYQQDIEQWLYDTLSESIEDNEGHRFEDLYEQRVIEANNVLEFFQDFTSKMIMELDLSSDNKHHFLLQYQIVIEDIKDNSSFIVCTAYGTDPNNAFYQLEMYKDE